MLRGLANLSFWADDVPAAVRWYTELLGVEPYFVRPESGPPQYVEWRIGDSRDEVSITSKSYEPEHSSAGPGGAVMYWHVDDVPATFDKLLSMGATEYQPVIPRGEAGFVTAAVVDPFGNVLGIMYNPHYLEMLGSTNKAKPCVAR